MRKMLLIALMLFGASSAFAQVKNNSAQEKSQPNVQAAQKEVDKWDKLLSLNEEQKQRIFIICLTVINQKTEIEKNGGRFPPGPNREKDSQFQNVLTQDQFKEYVKITNKELPASPTVPPKNNGSQK